jgi:hypothetical protein
LSKDFTEVTKTALKKKLQKAATLLKWTSSCIQQKQHRGKLERIEGKLRIYL